MPKQVRFTQLVKASGHPHAASLWVTDPNDDPDFKKAIVENRVLTIQNINVGTKKDAGEIGFRKMGNSTYLIFPKSLSMQPGTKVIGLKFDELKDAAVKDPVKVKEAVRKPKIERVKTAEPSVDDFEPAKKTPIPAGTATPKPKAASTFTVTLRFTATVQRDVEVKAQTTAGAIEAAMKQSSKLSPKKATWVTEAVDVKAAE